MDYVNMVYVYINLNGSLYIWTRSLHTITAGCNRVTSQTLIKYKNKVDENLKSKLHVSIQLSTWPFLPRYHGDKDSYGREVQSDQ